MPSRNLRTEKWIETLTFDSLDTDEINNIIHAEPGDDLATKASEADNGKLVLGEGTYDGSNTTLTSGQLVLDDIDLLIEGAGRGKTVLNFGIQQVNASIQQATLSIRDLTLSSDGTGVGVEIANLDDANLLSDVRIDNFDIGLQVSDSLLCDYYHAHIENCRVGVLFDSSLTSLNVGGNSTTHHFYGGRIFSNSEHNVHLRGDSNRHKFFGVTIDSGAGSATGMVHTEGINGEGAPMGVLFDGCDFEIYDTGRTVFASSGDAFHQSVGWQVIGGSIHLDESATIADITDDKEWTISGLVVQAPSADTGTININGSGSVRHRFLDLRSVNSATISINFNADNGVTVKRVDDVVTENDGQATIASGTAEVTVDHGLDVVPDQEDIELTFGQGPNGAAVVWPDNITTTQFDINSDAAPSADTKILWRVDASEGL